MYEDLDLTECNWSATELVLENMYRYFVTIALQTTQTAVIPIMVAPGHGPFQVAVNNRTVESIHSAAFAGDATHQSHVLPYSKTDHDETEI